MALQEVHEPSPPSCVVRQDYCVVHNMPAAAELHLLRARITQLEQALNSTAQAQAQVIALRTAAEPQTSQPAAQPAEEAVNLAAPCEPVTATQVSPESETADDASAFAAAWAEDDSSFEKRFAAREFFYDDGSESAARKWLLS